MGSLALPRYFAQIQTNSWAEKNHIQLFQRAGLDDGAYGVADGLANHAHIPNCWDLLFMRKFPFALELCLSSDFFFFNFYFHWIELCLNPTNLSTDHSNELLSIS